MRCTILLAVVPIIGVQGAPNPQGLKGVPKGLGKSPVAYGPKPSGCSSFEILVGRGTGEIGRFGLIVGDPLVSAVTRLVPGTRGYAVQYPADSSATSVSTGVNDTVQRLIAQDKACPSQKFALVGYSQGAGVMRGAAPKIPDSIQQNKILAVVMFGDPGLRRLSKEFPAPLQSRLFENCAVGDPVCTSGDSFGPHMTYNSAGTSYQRDSANFIAAAFKGKPLPSKPTAPSSQGSPPKGNSSPRGGSLPKGKMAGKPD